MATSTRRAGDREWGPMPVWLERLPMVAMWLVLICAGIFFVAQGLVALMVALQATPYFRSGGIDEALPLGLLASFLTFTWLPAFMPFLIPAVLLVVLIALPFTPAARRLWTRRWST